MPDIEVIVGRLGRARGLAGEMYVDLRTDSPERRFRPGSRLWAGRDLTVRHFRAQGAQGARGLVSFDQVRDRSAAEQLTGRDLVARVDPGETPDQAGEFFDHQLVGLTVVTTTGQPVGRLTRVDHLGHQDLLAVDTAAGERLVPFVDELVPEVDLSAGQLVVRPIPGLLDDAGAGDEA
jgi:16S rRNA processing protein RimM